MLVTKKGQRYDAPTKGNHANLLIPNSWIKLTERVRKDHADFRGLTDHTKSMRDRVVRESPTGSKQ